jgi:hypothetical protein
MSFKRSSSCLLLEEPRKKKARFVYKKPPVKYVLKLTGKRQRYKANLDEFNELFKRSRLEEPTIQLLISEASPVKKSKTNVFVNKDIEMAYCYSIDPRHFYAIDIQKIFRGWAVRKKAKHGLMLNYFS